MDEAIDLQLNRDNYTDTECVCVCTVCVYVYIRVLVCVCVCVCTCECPPFLAHLCYSKHSTATLFCGLVIELLKFSDIGN